ncbi:epidermal growth factor receptor substrate 15 homolog [Heteronotia binoei]|uniref:epidermal growth factor receptor substrate 15 homolog n=1 Tax=Heteronotia binoei TaxID=13085 RepID=UPI002931C801|nr:epidermal growth factor receptor substrate 15 homolog [Heteronotia binoei]
MGNDAEYQPCPMSPKNLVGEIRKKRNLGFVVAISVLSILFLTFMVLYLVQEPSDPAKRLQECQTKVQNQSFEAQAQIASLRQRVEETQEAAKKESGVWNHKLEALNTTLAETQNQLSALQDNFTSSEARVRSQKEEIKNLQQQLTEKSEQLADEQHKIQEERKRYQAEIQQLKQQQEQKQRDGGSRDFAGPGVALLTILIAGLLSV